MVATGQVLSLVVERPAAGGRMIARCDGQIALVAGVIPGERVRARIERVAKGVVFAQAVAVDEESPDRRAPFEDPLCGGCLYSHITYQRQLEIKRQVISDALARIGHITSPAAITVAASPEDGYRMRARLHVRGSRVGFYREGTHDLCDPRATRQLLPDTCDALDRFSARLRSLGISEVREIELSENRAATERAVALDLAAPIGPRALERLAATDGINGLASPSGEFGSAYLTDRLSLGDGATVSLRRHVAAFFQGNRHLLREFVAHVISQVPDGAELVDLYAGVGLFSIAAARTRHVRAVAVEGDRVAAADLSFNAEAVGVPVMAVWQPVERFIRGRAIEPNRSAASLVVIVDPPRTGVSPEALSGVMQLGPERLIYVSCDVATLARDSRKIVDGGYRLERLDAFDFFPNTPHIETVAVFDLPLASLRL